MLTRLAANKPDVIVFELGDGILGAYGVEAILRDAGIRDALTCLVLCANDPVAAWGGVKLLREDFGIEPAIVTGPATDNDVGKDIIVQRMGVKAINAVTDSMQLGDAVTTHVGLKLSQPEARPERTTGMSNRTPALIIGGTGYVAGELLRLVGQHPGLALAGVSSESQAGTPVSAAFPHLRPRGAATCPSSRRRSWRRGSRARGSRCSRPRPTW